MSNDAYHNMDANTQSAIHDSWVDEQERQYQKRAQLIAKFTDGWVRYNQVPLFRNIIEAAARGADPWDIINKLVDMNVEQAEAIKNYILYHGKPAPIPSQPKEQEISKIII